MEYNNVLNISNREEFRQWLIDNSMTQVECYVPAKRGKPIDEGILYYLDAVEEALCFGWIDSKQVKINSISYQRFSPRKKGSPWTELNKERARRLIKLGLMTKEGKKVLPNLGKNSFKIDIDLVNAFKKNRCYKTFKSFPDLYQRVRAYNVMFYKDKDKKIYESALNHLVSETRKGRMFGEWNDYGRLLNY